jgi:hypothetical protein
MLSRYGSIRAWSYRYLVFPFCVHDNQCRPGRFVIEHCNPARVDVIGYQFGQCALTGVVGADGSDQVDACAGT